MSTQKRQNDYLASLAVQQLQEQKARLATYRVQARYELAAMYDRAQNEEQGEQVRRRTPAPEQTAPAPAAEAPPAPEPRSSHDAYARASH